MNKITNFLVVGGDDRQLHMADFFEKKGFGISIYGLPESSERRKASDLKNAILECDSIIFPLPITKDGKNINSKVYIKESADEIIGLIDNSKIIFGGIISKGIENKLKAKGIKYYDYFSRDDLTIRNTVPTVQGILKVIFDNIDFTVHSSEIAVFGYGKVAKITADVLSSLGADVTVCARKSEDLMYAEIKKMKRCNIRDFSNISDKFDIIINTVPSIVIDRKILGNLKKNCLVIDVSSAPYGVDFASAGEFGIKALQCPSLPGKVAPKTAGIIIGETILEILKEENLWIN